jgi:hypothetical protein
MKYWYKYKHRGFSLGCQPKGFVDTDNGQFAGRFGAVAYDRELTAEEVNEYELEPWYKDEPVAVAPKPVEEKIQSIIDAFDSVMNTLSESGKLTDEVAQALMTAKTQSIIAVKGE